MPPSLAKCGVDSGCQSWVYTTSVPAARARAVSPFAAAGTRSPPRTYSDPFGSAKSFCTSTTRRAVRWSEPTMGESLPDLDHPLDRGASPACDVGLDRDLVLALAQGPEQLGGGDRLHVPAHGGFVRGEVVAGRVLLAEAV